MFELLRRKQQNLWMFQDSEVCVQAAGTDLGHRTSAEDSASCQSSLAGILHGDTWCIGSDGNQCSQKTHEGLTGGEKRWMREVYAEDERQNNNQYMITVTTKTLMEEEKRSKLPLLTKCVADQVSH